MAEFRISDRLRFASGTQSRQTRPAATWKVLVVDDEPEVHSITRLVLTGFRFRDRGLTLFNAHSANEAEQLLTANPDIAMVLLDVVMETETAGLDLVRIIRERMGNRFIRIILRTGQPGKAPEERVVIGYEIDDYKEKTELTSSRLIAAVTTALRTYGTLRALDRNRQGLEMVLNALSGMREHSSLKSFVNGVMMQITALLHFVQDTVVASCNGLAAATDDQTSLQILSASGSFCDTRPEELASMLPNEVLTLMSQAGGPSHCFGEGWFATLAGCGREGPRLLFYIGGLVGLSSTDRSLIEVFANNIASAYDNLCLVDALRRNNTRQDLLRPDQSTAILLPQVAQAVCEALRHETNDQQRARLNGILQLVCPGAGASGNSKGAPHDP